MLQYRVTSCNRSKNGDYQITVTVGEGRNRRSFTRHLNPARVGLNIDPRAIPLNELYEAELAEAKGKFANAEALVKSIEKKLDEVSKTPEKVDILTESMLLAAYTLLEEQLEAAEAAVADATVLVDDAEAKLDIVRRELPLMMEFKGLGLTY